MDRKEYIEGLEEIVYAKIYVTNRTDEIQKEIQSNHWSIGINSILAKTIEKEDLLLFLRKVKENRINQLSRKRINVELVYYLWFEEQAGKLNFNFINSNHTNLPFNSELEMVKSESIIIQDFLESKYLDGIPWDQLEDTDPGKIENIVNEPFRTKVFTEILKK